MTRTKLNVHHIVPRSRFKNDEDRETNNTLAIDEKVHMHWHAVFGNLTPEEAKRFIDEVMVAGRYWSNKDLERIRNKIKGEKNDKGKRDRKNGNRRVLY